ncbi:tripartite tricarboxylate transporter substrate binding protein [Acetobacteraceae bacterium H6797]|nr:tripartite tricarboxylate transporter substrate binding protein [Acetobacteraceae bacterium H6797]
MSFAIPRRRALAAALALPFLAVRTAAAFPDRPLRLVLGFPAGTGPDLVARLLADGLREAWPQGVVVDNKPGAAGFIAAQEVAKSAAPDGYTLLLGEVGQLAMAPSTYARLPYDPAKDFAPILEVASADFAFVVPASLPVSDMAGYVAWAKAQRSVFLATFGAGTPGHFGAAMLASAAGFNGEPVHFRATGDAVAAVLNGQSQGMFGTVALVTPHVRGGRMKALAVTGPARAPLLPDVPTVGELNLPSLAFSAWFGVVAPAAVPEAVQTSIEGSMRKALQGQALRARLEEAGFRPGGEGRQAFAALMRSETRRWAEVVRQTGFQAID